MPDPSHFHVIQARPFTTGSETGWEFTCPTCGYKARYHPNRGAAGPRLEILQMGDPLALHSNQPQGSGNAPSREQQPGREPDTALAADEMAWLAPASRQWLLGVLARLE